MQNLSLEDNLFLLSLRRSIIYFSLTIFLFYAGCTKSCNHNDKVINKTTNQYKFSSDDVLKDLKFFTASPHPLGSNRQKEIKNYIIKRALNAREVWTQSFIAHVPNPAAYKSGPAPFSLEKNGTNIIAAAGITPNPQCLVLLGSHYDTKKVPGIDYVGANDSGSSSALLLDVLRFLSVNKNSFLKCDIIAVWFDGEESFLFNWNEGLKSHPLKKIDNTYGSRYFVKSLINCKYNGKNFKCLKTMNKILPIISVIIIDMVGSKNIIFTQDENSSKPLLSLFKKSLKKLGYLSLLEDIPRSLEDDHTPFLKANIPAIDIIDFKHLDFWHKNGDYINNISLNSINIAAKAIIYMSLTISSNPKVLNN